MRMEVGGPGGVCGGRGGGWFTFRMETATASFNISHRFTLIHSFQFKKSSEIKKKKSFFFHHFISRNKNFTDLLQQYIMVYKIMYIS